MCQDTALKDYLGKSDKISFCINCMCFHLDNPCECLNAAITKGEIPLNLISGKKCKSPCKQKKEEPDEKKKTTHAHLCNLCGNLFQEEKQVLPGRNISCSGLATFYLCPHCREASAQQLLKLKIYDTATSRYLSIKTRLKEGLCCMAQKQGNTYVLHRAIALIRKTLVEKFPDKNREEVEEWLLKMIESL